MNNKTYIPIVALVGVFGLIGLLVFSLRGRDEAVPTLDQASPIAVDKQDDTDSSVLTTPTTIDDPVAVGPETDATSLPGTKISDRFYNYSADATEAALRDGSRVLLFFHAGWCPTCRSAEKDITENISDLPEDVVILKVDYDNSTELKNQYNVTSQHTFVWIDRNGEEVTQWRGGEVKTIVSNLENPL